jgi:hypothetical protein
MEQKVKLIQTYGHRLSLYSCTKKHVQWRMCETGQCCIKTCEPWRNLQTWLWALEVFYRETGRKGGTDIACQTTVLRYNMASLKTYNGTSNWDGAKASLTQFFNLHNYKQNGSEDIHRGESKAVRYGVPSK